MKKSAILSIALGLVMLAGTIAPPPSARSSQA
jgi:hypothetical protein